MKALLIIDVQNDYFAGGKAELVNPDIALIKTQMILDIFRKKQLPIIHVQHINVREGATFFLPYTGGANIHQRLAPKDDEHLVVKHFPNSFYQTNLLELIQDKQITELVV